jgi:hypothetical protein
MSVDASAAGEWYLEGGCATFAFAVHWMTGWPVMALQSEDPEAFSHFSAFDLDGVAWDAGGPRTATEAAAAWTDDPAWSPVDPMRTILSEGVAEADITEACHAAIALFEGTDGWKPERAPT